MKTDISKLSFDELKHYLGVFLQMGRVQLDSDWNEQSEIWLRMLQRQAHDVAGDGSPNHGFRVDDRILLDALDSRQGWVAEDGGGVAVAGQPVVDYFQHRTGDGALEVTGAAALARRLDEPGDWAGLAEIVIAVQGGFAAADLTFFVDAGGGRQDFATVEDPDDLEGWRIFRATPPGGLDLSEVEEYGFRNLDDTELYRFDFLKADLPIRRLVVPTGYAEPFEATPLAVGDVPELSIDDDARLWRSTSLAAHLAGSVSYRLPVPLDLSHARRLVFAVRSPQAGAQFRLRLTDVNNNQQNHGPVAVAAADTWQRVSFEAPAAGFGPDPIDTVEWRGLDADDYLFSPVVAEMELDGNLVIMGGDGSSEGAGRFYGGGLAAVKENHETYFSQADLPEADPGPLAEPGDDRCRTDIAYLDLWERPITYIEDPEIREIALEGTDTCTRTQLISQVRLLRGDEYDLGDAAAGEAAFADLEARFAALPECGDGTLTTKDRPDAVQDPCADPCEPKIDGTFVGEENRLYRVEIHRCGDIGAEGDPGTATFKWSSENGAVASPLIERAESGPGAFSVRVEKPELFAEGDLIEISDDLVDLITGEYEDRVDHRCHQRGELRRITAIHLANRTISWDDGSGAGFHASLGHSYSLAHHARIRRWSGLGWVEAGDIVLDDGVVIEFGGEGFMPADYWVFTTRVADGSVERLIEEPPRGICHRFHKLATISTCNDAGTVERVIEDCRKTFNPLSCLDASDIAFDPGRCAAADGDWAEVETVQEAIEMLCGRSAGGGCCTVTVGDGELSQGDFNSIQLAIDSLDGHGGVVCLLRGTHRVRGTVQVPSNVLVKGAGAATRVVHLPAEPGAALFEVANGSRNVRFESFFAVTETGDSVIRIAGARQIGLRDLTLANLNLGSLDGIFDGEVQLGSAVHLAPADDGGGITRGLTLSHCRMLAMTGLRGEANLEDAHLADCRMRTPLAGLWLSNAERLTVTRCDLAGLDDGDLDLLVELGFANEDEARASQGQIGTILDQEGDPALLGYFAGYASQVHFEQCRVQATIGLAPLLGALHSVHQTTITGYFNILLPFHFFCRIEGCNLVGLINVLQGGIQVGLEMHHNRLLGLYGVLFVSLGFMILLLLYVFAEALGAGQALPASIFGGVNLQNGAQVGQQVVGGLDGFLAFGLITAVTVRDNFLLSLLTGVEKQVDVFSSDLQIVGNRIYLGLAHGVLLEGDRENALGFLGGLLAPGHAVAENHMSVFGVGVETAVHATTIRHNQIRALGDAGIRLRASGCEVKCNTLLLDDDNATDGIRVGSGESDLTLEGNSIGNGGGSGVLFEGFVSSTVVRDNRIEWMQHNGITTATEASTVVDLEVRGNRIRFCGRGDAEGYPLNIPGGIVLGDGIDVKIADNEVTNCAFVTGLAGYGIYLEDLEGTRVTGNRIRFNGNFGLGPNAPQGAGLRIRRGAGDVQVLGNYIEGNHGVQFRVDEATGLPLYIGQFLDLVLNSVGAMGRNAYAYQEILGWAAVAQYLSDYYANQTDVVFQTMTVSGNSFIANSTGIAVDLDDINRLVFSDNRVRAQRGDGVSALNVAITANHLIFNGNHVEVIGGVGNSTSLVRQGAAARFVLANNILSGAAAQLPPFAAGTTQNLGNLFF